MELAFSVYTGLLFHRPSLSKHEALHESGPAPSKSKAGASTGAAEEGWLAVSMLKVIPPPLLPPPLHELVLFLSQVCPEQQTFLVANEVGHILLFKLELASPDVTVKVHKYTYIHVHVHTCLATAVKDNISLK